MPASERHYPAAPGTKICGQFPESSEQHAYSMIPNCIFSETLQTTMAFLSIHVISCVAKKKSCLHLALVQCSRQCSSAFPLSLEGIPHVHLGPCQELAGSATLALDKHVTFGSSQTRLTICGIGASPCGWETSVNFKLAVWMSGILQV